MSKPPVPAPSHSDASRFSRWRERGYLVGALLINAILALQITHVLRWPAYQSSGRFHYVLLWALAVNLLSSALLFALRPEEDGRAWSRIHFCDWAVCLLILVMIRVLRIPNPEHMQHVFGVVYGGFVFLRMAVLVAWVRQFHDASRRVLHRAVFLASFIVYFAITPWVAATAGTNGDEPHYLLLSHSLLHDRDFDLRNNYDHQDYTAFYWWNLTARHVITNARGQQMPFHDVGLSMALVPGYAIGNRLGAMVEMNLFAAFLAAGIFELALILGGCATGAMACWALFAFVSPLVSFAAQIYPEIPGAALSIWAVVFFARFMETASPAAMPMAGCLLALLPWLSIRFWVVLGPIALIMAVYLVRSLGSSGAAWRELAWLVLPTAASLLIFCCFDLWGYGKFEPNAGYFFFVPTIGIPMFQPQLHVGLLGLFFDRAYGLLPTAPIYFVAIAGIWIGLRTRLVLALILLAPAVATILFTAVNHWWYGGVTPPPSRYILVALALLAPFAGTVLSRGIARIAIAALAAWSFVVAFEYTAFPELRHVFWDSGSAGIVQVIHARTGLDFGLLFPSLLTPVRADYLRAGAWAVGVAVLVAIILLRRYAAPDAITVREARSARG